MLPDTATTPSAPTLGQIVGKLEAELVSEHFGTGPLAALRRLDPRVPPLDATLHRLLVRHADARVERDGIATWTLILHAMTLAAPGRLQRGIGLGGPLFAAGLKEGRLTRLLEARPDELAVAVPRMVRFLVAHGAALDPLALAHVVLDLAAGGERAERQRTRIARDYYRAEYDARDAA